MRKQTIKPLWREVLSSISEQMIEHTQAQTATWPDSTWSLWDQERRTLLAKYSDLSLWECGWIAFMRMRFFVTRPDATADWASLPEDVREMIEDYGRSIAAEAVGA